MQARQVSQNTHTHRHTHRHTDTHTHVKLTNPTRKDPVQLSISGQGNQRTNKKNGTNKHKNSKESRTQSDLVCAERSQCMKPGRVLNMERLSKHSWLVVVLHQTVADWHVVKKTIHSCQASSANRLYVCHNISYTVSYATSCVLPSPHVKVTSIIFNSS